ncbi:hypothetical protein B0T14DRAFT_557171 [Immersiella caudata]|uniref:Uncharacterized protein n=1 Tax=Immersiella caudata TaxID=314043 RepID=A0AA39WE04_9PEZI|nr:hypothetical protein B0T14DRAFT_557171 [Immersiella caudata]
MGLQMDTQSPKGSSTRDNTANSSARSSFSPTPRSESYSSLPPRCTTPTSMNSQGTSMQSTRYTSYSYEASMNDGTLYGRLANWNTSGFQSQAAVPHEYSRIPAYCVRAALVIDDFEKMFEQNSNK